MWEAILLNDIIRVIFRHFWSDIVSLLANLSTQFFDTRRERWEELLKTELKLTEVGTKITKKTLDSGSWPILSLESATNVQLPVKEPWKKSSQTYVQASDIENSVSDDLENGVRNFFFHKEFLSETAWNSLVKLFEKYEKPQELEIFLLGPETLKTSETKFNVIDEVHIASGRLAHEQGGSNVQELGLLASQFIDKLNAPQNCIYLGVFVDSQFFRNIAKIRAAKLLAAKILETSGAQKEIKVLALTSYRDWTLYERYSNMLRNDASVASAYIGGADNVQSSGYQTLFELEIGPLGPDHLERSRRMARNTCHILALESLLGVVGDAAFGSYHLENLTQKYCEEAWDFMQKCQTQQDAIEEFVSKECAPVAKARVNQVRTRRHVLAGINDFPDVKEKLNLVKNPVSRFFRVAQGFENLRLKMESIQKKPKVYLALFGNMAALNSRINFVKNYFELLGLEVSEPHQSENNLVSFHENLSKNDHEVLVLVASDEDYARLGEVKTSAAEKFLAGKQELPGFTNLYAGQDVFEILEGLVNRWGQK